jgi:hypothetical protein
MLGFEKKEVNKVAVIESDLNKLIIDAYNVMIKMSTDGAAPDAYSISDVLANMDEEWMTPEVMSLIMRGMKLYGKCIELAKHNQEQLDKISEMDEKLDNITKLLKKMNEKEENVADD